MEKASYNHQDCPQMVKEMTKNSDLEVAGDVESRREERNRSPDLAAEARKRRRDTNLGGGDDGSSRRSWWCAPAEVEVVCAGGLERTGDRSGGDEGPGEAARAFRRRGGADRRRSETKALEEHEDLHRRRGGRRRRPGDEREGRVRERRDEEREFLTSEVQWPFSSMVFLPPRYNYNMPAKAPAQENEHIYPVTAPSLWYISSTGRALNHNANPSSLTLVYSGSVHVYHGVSPATVEAIKSMASREHSPPMTVETKQTSLAQDNNNLQPANAAAYPREMTPAKSIAGALTMARKATLARFLEKRKYRLSKANPYEVASEKKLYCPTPQFPTPSFFNLLPTLLQEGSSSNYT